jgi:hypothetical protein
MEPIRCQARPAALRAGDDADDVCAADANRTVSFREREVPVCRLHEATYAAWGELADENAAELWGWCREWVDRALERCQCAA